MLMAPARVCYTETKYGGFQVMRAFLPTDDRLVLVTPAAAKAARAELEQDGGSGFIRITMNSAEILSPRYDIDFESEFYRPGS